MNINLTTRHLQSLTPALRSYAVEKISQKLNHHFEHLISVNIRLGVSNLVHKADATISVPGKTLHASAVAENLYKAIDLLVPKLVGQVEAYKKRMKNRRLKRKDKQIRERAA